jgi:hypothetical protein
LRRTGFDSARRRINPQSRKPSRFLNMRKRLKLFYVWLIVGVWFYLVDCLVATSFNKTSIDIPWFERGIYAGGPFGIVLTVSWLVFPVGRVIFKRIKTRPRG